MLKWIERSRTENAIEEDKESEEIFRKLASKGEGDQSNNRNLLYLLIRIAFMVYLQQQQSEKPKNELPHKCLLVIKGLLRVLPNADVSFPILEKII